MKQFSGIWLFVMAVAMTLSSCEVVGGIFKAGFYSAIIVIVLVIVIILWLVRRGRR
ncbi:MAG: phosphatidate cytidylyltransferase [Chitinophagaceae bacterium]|nr:MAG: phosphatidate cytidylyltransferase [Chitinophagaceae bacterium]